MRVNIFALIILSAVSVTAFAHGSADKHVQDFLDVIDGYDDYSLRQFYKGFTSDIDKFKDSETSSSVTARIKRLIAKKKGISVNDVRLRKHRYIAHQWPYQGAIPKADLMLIENDYPGTSEDIIRIWAEFCREKNDYITSEFALQRSPWVAKAYCAIVYYTHLLGDWLPPPENKDFEYVMPIDRIVEGIMESVRSVGRSDAHTKYCDELAMKLTTAKALGGNSPQQQAVKILEALKAAKIGTMFHERFGVNGQMDESRHPYRAEEQPLRKAA